MRRRLPHPAHVGFPQDLHSSFQHMIDDAVADV